MTSTETTAVGPTAARGHLFTLALTVPASGAIAGSVAAAICAVVPSGTEIPGLSTAGDFVELSLPAVRAMVDVAAAATIGWLLAAGWLVPARRSGRLSPDGRRALVAASWSAAVWAVGSFALIPLILSDTLGRPVDQSLSPRWLLGGIDALNTVRAALIAGIVAMIIAVLARGIRHSGWAVALMVLALAALVPQADSGHSAAAGDHDIAVSTMMYHLIGISLWVGGLIAFLGLALLPAERLAVVAMRFSPIALVSFVAVATSGMGSAWIRIGHWSQLWQTDYGRLLLIKASLLTLLGSIGYLHRRRTLPDVARGGRRPLVRLATVEVTIMAVTVGVASALARTANPPADPTGLSKVELILGFTLNGPPTALGLLDPWRFDWLFGTASVGAAIVYLLGVRRVYRNGVRWPPGRTVAWLLGCLTVLVGTSSGIARYALGEFSIHMIAHMLLAMMAPILLALGGPITLALRALPASGRDQPPGLREAIVWAMHARVLRLITHPLVVAAVFVVSFYALYFTPAFDTLMTAHVGHLVMNLHFLLVGYLYYWVIIGVDPSPWQPSHPVKLGMLMAALPFHAFFGLTLMNSHSAIATDFYSSLALPWIPDLVAEQQLGGAIAWGFTEIPTVIVMVALMAQWARSDDRAARRSDRIGDRRADDELVAYNRMLEQLAHRDRRGRGNPPVTRSATAPQPAGPRSDQRPARRPFPERPRNEAPDK